MSCWVTAALILIVIAIAVAIATQACRRSGFDASNPTPFCSPKTNSCVGCVTDSDCLGGVCDNGTCVECTETNVSRCASDKQVCASGHCQMCKVDSKGVAVGCKGSQICDAGVCANCITDKDCPSSGIDNLDFTRPGPGACRTGPDGVRACAECRIDASGKSIGCPPHAPICGGDGRCYTCTRDGDCSGTTPRCLTSAEFGRGSCVECLECKDCPAGCSLACAPDLVAGGNCYGGICIGGVSDSGCDPNAYPQRVRTFTANGWLTKRGADDVSMRQVTTNNIADCINVGKKNAAQAIQFLPSSTSQNCWYWTKLAQSVVDMGSNPGYELVTWTKLPTS